MSISFLPRLIYPALTAVNCKDLYQKGIRLLMLDFDNTIVPYTTNVPTGKMKAWLENAKCSGLYLCVVSNTRRSRAPEFCKTHGLDCITGARKPLGKGINTCMRRYGLQPQQCALAGDQIYTDVLGANAAGVLSILVPAIDNHNIWLKLRHVLEQPWILLAKKRRV